MKANLARFATAIALLDHDGDEPRGRDAMVTRVDPRAVGDAAVVVTAIASTTSGAGPIAGHRWT